MRSTISCIILHTVAKITTDTTQLLFPMQKDIAAIQEKQKHRYITWVICR